MYQHTVNKKRPSFLDFLKNVNLCFRITSILTAWKSCTNKNQLAKTIHGCCYMVGWMLSTWLKRSVILLCTNGINRAARRSSHNTIHSFKKNSARESVFHLCNFPHQNCTGIATLRYIIIDALVALHIPSAVPIIASMHTSQTGHHNVRVVLLRPSTPKPPTCSREGRHIHR